jgi:hypothetical protein
MAKMKSGLKPRDSLLASSGVVKAAPFQRIDSHSVLQSKNNEIQEKNHAMRGKETP